MGVKQPKGKGAPVLVRAAVPEDLPAIAKLWEASSREFAQVEPLFSLQPDALETFRGGLEAWMDNPQHMVAVAEVEGEVVGFVHGRIAGRSPVAAPSRIGRVEDFVAALGLALDLRTEAIRALLAEAAGWFTRVGVELVDLHVPAYESPRAFEAMGLATVYYRMRGKASSLAARVSKVALYKMPVVYPGTDDFQLPR